jgi:hypothetical protein
MMVKELRIASFVMVVICRADDASREIVGACWSIVRLPPYISSRDERVSSDLSFTRYHTASADAGTTVFRNG